MTIQFIASDVFLNIFKLLDFLLMRHPYSEFTYILLSCSTSRTPITDGHNMSVQIITSVAICHNSPITDGHQMSVQIITSVAICHNSPITLHYNTVFIERTKFSYIKQPHLCNNHNIYQYLQSQPTRTLRNILSRCKNLGPEPGSRSGHNI